MGIEASHMMDKELHIKECFKGFREKAKKPRGPGKVHTGSSQPHKVRDRAEKGKSTSLQFVGIPLQGGNPGNESSVLL